MNSTSQKKYDLEERVSKFGESVINLLGKVKINEINKPLISQLIRSSTSVGANYLEANAANSKKDFRYKISLSRKESNESKHWLRMLSTTNQELDKELKKLKQESHELTLIFSKIIRSCNSETSRT